MNAPARTMDWATLINARECPTFADAIATVRRWIAGDFSTQAEEVSHAGP